MRGQPWYRLALAKHCLQNLSRNFSQVSCGKTRTSCNENYIDEKFRRFDTIALQQGDRRTDGQTDGRTPDDSKRNKEK